MQDKRKILYQSDYCKKEDACKEKMFAKRRCLQKKKMMENAYKEYEMKQNIIRRKNPETKLQARKKFKIKKQIRTTLKMN